ncbi:DNA methylase [Pseudomonas oryzihabitans]|uniref:DNA methylase n=1 Tax=Pseudomonas oryzihabitans TaxID=47885 RepID=UPI0028954549|nr:DNA methylase [Pseudomonas oryzihabitans]MDT3721869.1 DNA methylase [Pseudomonas oryzihabitans]
MGKTTSAADLGLTLAVDDESALFGWFLASYLFGKRISQTIAAQAWTVLYRTHGRDTPRKVLNLTWQQLVDYLGEGHYRRYDESTATRLLEVCRHLQEEYGGSFVRLRDASMDRADFERRLQTLKGVGPKTCEIFMREAGPLLFPG